MNRMFKLALTVVLGSALVVPALAQDMYKDVPESHWAYEAIARLRKDGILVDDGSGKFLGRCNVTRYEMAVTIDRMYRVVLSKFQDQQSQIDALKSAVDGMKPGDNGDLKARVDELSAMVSSMKGWGDDIATLQRLTNEFQKELSGLGANVEEMKAQLASLDERVTKLEQGKGGLTIGADADLLVLSGGSDDRRYGLTWDGSITGWDRGSRGGGFVGLTQDTTVLHQLALKLATNNETGANGKATLVMGNVLGTLGQLNADRGLNAGVIGADATANFDDANSDIYFQELYATWNANLAGQGLKAKAGRFGHKVGQYLYQRAYKGNQYFSNETRENGEFYMDGAAVGFGFGKGDVTVFFGRNSELRSNNGVDINPIILGANVDGPLAGGVPTTMAKVDTTLGFQLAFPLGEVAKLNLAYLQHDSYGAIASAAGRVNRVNVYGGEITAKVNNIDLMGAYSKGGMYDNGTSRVTNDNAAWDINAKYGAEKFSLGAGYRRVERNFAAAADTGRFGTWTTPVNFEGFNVKASFNASDAVTLYGMGEFVKGVQAMAGGVLASSDDKIDAFTLGLKYKLNDFFNVGLSYEDNKFKRTGVADAKQKWYTLGFGYAIGGSSNLSLKYILSDVDNGARAIGTSAAGQFRGGLLATQISVKF